MSRGPVVYCLEEADNGKDLHLVSLGDKPNFTVQYREELLDGIAVITNESLIYDKTCKRRDFTPKPEIRTISPRPSPGFLTTPDGSVGVSVK